MTRKTSIVLGASAVLLAGASAGAVSADTARHPAEGTLRVQGRVVHVDPAAAQRITTGHGTASDYRPRTRRGSPAPCSQASQASSTRR